MPDLPPLLGDHPVLDLVGTVSERTTLALERLATPADLDTWLVRAGVLDGPAGADATDLERARALREALNDLLVAATTGRPLPRPALALVNTAAAGTSTAVQLTASGAVRRTGDVAAALTDLARAGVDLLGGPDLARVRWCADDTCTHPFLDRSRAGRRRWCGMTGCGDRNKARAYRARRAAATG